jgi:hypothetical protein
MQLARQMFPGKIKSSQEIFTDATSLPFSYLLMDLISEATERLRLCIEIVSDDKHYAY